MVRYNDKFSFTEVLFDNPISFLGKQNKINYLCLLYKQVGVVGKWGEKATLGGGIGVGILNAYNKCFMNNFVNYGVQMGKKMFFK